MKKNNFTLLVLLVLCVTILGAYATWNYVTADNVSDLNKSVSVNLAEDTVTTASGGTLTATGSISALIDNGGEYKAAFVASGDGFTVAYDATGSTTPDVTAINMQATISATSVTEYNGVDILTVKTTTIYSNGAVSSWTITPAEIAACIEMADITLPTPTDYNALEAAMAATNTELTITIGAVPSSDS